MVLRPRRKTRKETADLALHMLGGKDWDGPYQGANQKSGRTTHPGMD